MIKRKQIKEEDYEVKTFMVGVIFFVFASVEVKILLKNKNWNEVVIVFLLYSVGFTLCFLLSIGVKVSNPNKYIIYLIKMWQ